MKSFYTILLVAGLASGCGKSDESIAESTGNKVGEVLTDFAGGVGEGVDKRLEVTAELSDQCDEVGLTKTVAKSQGLGQGISIYFIAEKPFVGQILVKAFSAEGQEIGRSKVEANFEMDDAKYVDFSFDAQMDTQLVEKYLVDVRPPAKVDAPLPCSSENTESAF